MSLPSPTARLALQLAREARVPAAETLLEKQLVQRLDDSMASQPRYFRRDARAYARQLQHIMRADPGRKAVYAEALGNCPRVGLSRRSFRLGWAGQEKSAVLKDFLPLLELAGLSWMDLQYGDMGAVRAEPHKIRVSLRHFDHLDYRDDQEDVLEILSVSDFPVTPSNASAHFAVALGKPIWLILPRNHPLFQYWEPNATGQCPWYLSLEIVSNSEPGWQSLIAQSRVRILMRYV
jgi:hypothetical protein